MKTFTLALSEAEGYAVAAFLTCQPFSYSPDELAVEYDVTLVEATEIAAGCAHTFLCGPDLILPECPAALRVFELALNALSDHAEDPDEGEGAESLRDRIAQRLAAPV